MARAIAHSKSYKFEETEKQYQERVAKAMKIVRKGFSPLGPGEKLGRREITRKLRELASFWDIPPYSHMNVQELRDCYRQIKRDIKLAYLRPTYFDR